MGYSLVEDLPDKRPEGETDIVCRICMLSVLTKIYISTMVSISEMIKQRHTVKAERHAALHRGEVNKQAEATGFCEWEKKRHLSSFGLVLDVLRGADFGLDVLEVRQWLVDDAKLLGCRGG